MILYSIIIAVYNVEKYLKECLESIVNQTYANWEAILIDDGSNDNYSAKICDEYAEKDSRFKVYHRTNEGSLMARHYGAKYASGEYVLFADADDILHKDLLYGVNNIIEQTGSDLVIYRYQSFAGIQNKVSDIVFPEGTIIGEGGLTKELIWKKVVSGVSLNSLCQKVTKKENICADFDFAECSFLKSGTDLMQSLPILDNAKKIYFSEKVYYYYRSNDNGISSLKKKNDIDTVKEQLRTRDFIMGQKLRYLQKNNYASDENLKSFYMFCFNSNIHNLLTRLENSTDREHSKMLIELSLNDDILKAGMPYIKIDDFNGQNKILFMLYSKGSHKIYPLLYAIALKKRFIGTIFRKMIKHKS